MMRVMKQADKANGYVFGDEEERNVQSMLSCAIGAEFEYEKVKTVQEKFMDKADDENQKTVNIDETMDDT